MSSKSSKRSRSNRSRSNKSKRSKSSSNKSSSVRKNNYKHTKLSEQLITDDVIKKLFLDNCKEDIDQLVKKSKKKGDNLEVFNKQDILNYCNCLSKKISIKSIKNIDKSFYSKCINKSKRDSKKRLTKHLTNKYKKSLKVNSKRKSKTIKSRKSMKSNRK
jgi:hypothetical protein